MDRITHTVSPGAGLTRGRLEMPGRVHALAQYPDDVHPCGVRDVEQQVASHGVSAVSRSDVLARLAASRIFSDAFDRRADVVDVELGLSYVPTISCEVPNQRRVSLCRWGEPAPAHDFLVGEEVGEVLVKADRRVACHEAMAPRFGSKGCRCRGAGKAHISAGCCRRSTARVLPGATLYV